MKNNDASVTMVDISELHIGSIIRYNGAYHIINLIDLRKNLVGFFDKIRPVHVSKIEPIKLNSGILSRVGYHIQKRQHDEGPYWFDRRRGYGEPYRSPGLYIRKSRYGILGGTYSPIDYLHQLQNVYRTFTGTELHILPAGCDKRFNTWLQLRREGINEYNEKLCYCGHTYKCTCGDPDINTFADACERGVIKYDDINNGWENK